MKVPNHPPLAKDSVNYVGDHVAVVIAESIEEAKKVIDAQNKYVLPGKKGEMLSIYNPLLYYNVW